MITRTQFDILIKVSYFIRLPNPSQTFNWFLLPLAGSTVTNPLQMHLCRQFLGWCRAASRIVSPNRPIVSMRDSWENEYRKKPAANQNQQAKMPAAMHRGEPVDVSINTPVNSKDSFRTSFRIRICTKSEFVSIVQHKIRPSPIRKYSRYNHVTSSLSSLPKLLSRASPFHDYTYAIWHSY